MNNRFNDKKSPYDASSNGIYDTIKNRNNLKKGKSEHFYGEPPSGRGEYFLTSLEKRVLDLERRLKALESRFSLRK